MDNGAHLPCAALHQEGAEVIHHYQLLTEEYLPENLVYFLWPGIPRDGAFGCYYQEKVDLQEQRRCLKHRLIVISNRQVDELKKTTGARTGVIRAGAQAGMRAKARPGVRATTWAGLDLGPALEPTLGRVSQRMPEPNLEPKLQLEPILEPFPGNPRK